MNSIRYEPVFGDQKFFNGAPDDAVYVRYGRDIFIFNSEINCTAGSLRDIPIIAMRRIIRTPVWTKEDQLAGKLPEVGCIVRVSPTENAKVVAVNTKMSVMAVQCNDESIDVLDIHEILPFETDAERQQREREEWCSKALDSAGILSEMKHYELKRLGEYIGSIHDALLSGELKMPEVQK